MKKHRCRLQQSKLKSGVIVLLLFLLPAISSGSVAEFQQHEPVLFLNRLPAISAGDSMPFPETKLTRLVYKLSEKNQKNKKIVAIALAIALGPFGVHRLYLGTDTKVPVFYTATLGGGLGILPITDIIAILLTDDLEKFQNNAKIVMWMRKAK